MKKVTIILALFFCLGSVVFVRNSDAAYYKYIDKDGVVCFADNLQVIPEQYRAQAVIVETEAKDDEIKTAGPAARKTEIAPTAGINQEMKGPRPLSTRLMISGAIGLGAFLLFFVVSSQSELKENKKVLALVRASLLAVVSLYLVFAHAMDVMTMFGMAGHVVAEAQHKSEEKGKKAAQAVKALDAMFEDAQKAQKAQETTTGQAPDNN